MLRVHSRHTSFVCVVSLPRRVSIAYRNPLPRRPGKGIPELMGRGRGRVGRAGPGRAGREKEEPGRAGPGRAGQWGRAWPGRKKKSAGPPGRAGPNRKESGAGRDGAGRDGSGRVGGAGSGRVGSGQQPRAGSGRAHLTKQAWHARSSLRARRPPPDKLWRRVCTHPPPLSFSTARPTHHSPCPELFVESGGVLEAWVIVMNYVRPPP